MNIYLLTTEECGRDWCSTFEMLVVASSAEEAIQLAEEGRARGEVDEAFVGNFRVLEEIPFKKGIIYQAVEVE